MPSNHGKVLPNFDQTCVGPMATVDGKTYHSLRFSSRSEAHTGRPSPFVDVKDSVQYAGGVGELFMKS